MNPETPKDPQPAKPETGQSLGASPEKPPPVAHEPNAEKKERGRPRKRERREWTRLGVEVLTLIAVGWYASIAYRQLHEMREANRFASVAQQQAQQVIADADRPWLGVAHFNLVKFQPREKIVTAATILNSGKTPALDVVTRTGYAIQPELPSQTPEIRAPDFGHMVTLPNMNFLLPIITDNPITAEEFDAIRNGKLKFIIGGLITYEDRWRRRHETRFCGYYNPETIEQSPISICTVGNSAR